MLAAVALIALMAAHGPGSGAGCHRSGDRQGRRYRNHTSPSSTMALTGLDPQLAQLPDRPEARRSAVRPDRRASSCAKDADKEGLQNDCGLQEAPRLHLTDRELHNAYFKKHVVDAVKPDEVKARYDAEIAKMPRRRKSKRPSYPGQDRGRSQGDHQGSRRRQGFRRTRQGKVDRSEQG